MTLDVLNIYKEKGFIIPSKRLIKTEEQIEGIRKSCQLTKKVLDMISEHVKAGITTNQINELVHDFTIKNGAIPSPLNYHSFPKSVCTSINNVICHGIPDNTMLKDGDIINIDVTCTLNGYFGDASRMFTIGEVSEKAKQLIKVSKECLYLGIEQVKPFNDVNEIGRVIEPYANKFGFSVVQDYCGHGIGSKFHEDPQVIHYKEKKKGMLLLPGMVFTIEPMINEGSYKSKVLSDGWTAVTKDGKLSAQWEHTILVTSDGADILTE